MKCPSCNKEMIVGYLNAHPIKQIWMCTNTKGCSLAGKRLDKDQIAKLEEWED